eukprot:TRINITY_DN9283_c0_g2_i2.p1 TRINITY_DN9283_c0_g2~~TRINITY_DN9283_c0_g2_i2.p1  ORF type:complete len:454 (+),score=109.53 TRINITY_DN9283_c0_g2_i2:90-1451(+)
MAHPHAQGRRTVTPAVGVAIGVIVSGGLLLPAVLPPGAEQLASAVPILRSRGWRTDPCDGAVCPRSAFVQGSNARQLLVVDGPWQAVDRPELATLIWLRNHRRLGLRPDPKSQLYNKLPTDSPMTDKVDLAINVQEWESARGIESGSAGSIIPETHAIVHAEDVSQLRLLPWDTSTPWLLKDGRESMGRGVHVIPDVGSWLASPNATELQRSLPRHRRSPHRQWVLQRYVRPPLLLEGRKCEVRLYWAVLSMEPLIAAVYSEGQVRLNSMPYSDSDFANPMRHLTNAWQQRGHPDYDRLMADGELKWTLPRWRSYLTTQKGFSAAQVARAERAMRWSLTRVVNATARKLAGTWGDGHPGGRFQVFGADFLLDSSLRVYLTEVQGGPGLSHGDPVKRKLVGGLLNGACELAYAMLLQRRQGRPAGELGGWAQHGYELLVNEGTEPPYHYGGADG